MNMKMNMKDFDKYGIDARVCAIAERIWKESPIRREEIEKERRKGSNVDYGIELWDNSRSRLYLSPEKVAEYWRAAGCKNNRKFRAQVRYNLRAARSQTANQFIHYAEGLRWIDEADLAHLALFHHPKRNTAAVLGKLSPAMRWAALIGVFEKKRMIHGVGEIKITDLNWEAVRRASEAKKAGNMRVYAALAYPPAVMKEFGLSSEEELVAFICPAYPKLSYLDAREIALGASPVELSCNKLTRKEAHQWLLDGASTGPCTWFADKHELPYHRSIKVLRWLKYLKDSGRWDTLIRPHPIETPHGVMRRSALQMLDEIQDEDILSGKDSARNVLQRAIERMGKEEVENLDEPLAPMPEWARKLPKWMRLLRTRGDLLLESTEMKHCVKTYEYAVKKGQCHILSLATRYGRSTVELSPDLMVVQHRGIRDGNPPPRNELLLRAFLNRLKRIGQANRLKRIGQAR